MGLVKSGFSAIGRLAAISMLAVAFLLGMAGVVYMSLQGSEIQVPEITGKDFSQSERELAALGLKIKKRADRFSLETPNTVIEQLPKPGDVVKTGQMILVVTSKGEGENGEKLSTLKKIAEEDDSDKIEELIDDKPKKKSNSNTRKKADTTRDVSANTNSGPESASSNSNKKETGSNNNSSEKPDKNDQPATNNKQPNSGTKSSGDVNPKPPRRP